MLISLFNQLVAPQILSVVLPSEAYLMKVYNLNTVKSSLVFGTFCSEA